MNNFQSTSGTTDPSFTIVTGGRNYEFAVHAAGCRDLARYETAVRCNQYTQTAASAEALIDSEVADFTACDQGWTHDHFHIFPCAEKLTRN